MNDPMPRGVFLFIWLPVFFAETAYLLARSLPRKLLDQDFCSVSALFYSLFFVLLGVYNFFWGGCYRRNLTSIRSIDRPRRAVEQVQKLVGS